MTATFQCLHTCKLFTSAKWQKISLILAAHAEYLVVYYWTLSKTAYLFNCYVVLTCRQTDSNISSLPVAGSEQHKAIFGITTLGDEVFVSRFWYPKIEVFRDLQKLESIREFFWQVTTSWNMQMTYNPALRMNVFILLMQSWGQRNYRNH